MQEGSTQLLRTGEDARSLVARSFEWVRYAPLRIRHRSRRRTLLARLATGPCPGSVLFVCLGNICRSPYAAAAFERAIAGIGRRVRVTSAGFLAPGRGCPVTARRVAAARGVDLSAHRSAALTPTVLAGAQLVVVMEPRQARHLGSLPAGSGRTFVVLGDLDPAPIETRSIPDPVDGPEEAFRITYDRIDRCVRELASAVRVSCMEPVGGPGPSSPKPLPAPRDNG